MENKIGERSIAWNVLALLPWRGVVACLWVDGKRRPGDSCELHHIDACIDFTNLQVALEKSLTSATVKNNFTVGCCKSGTSCPKNSTRCPCSLPARTSITGKGNSVYNRWLDQPGICSK